ncbi:MAG: Maf family protein [Nitriliruptoraceae bacterium]
MAEPSAADPTATRPTGTPRLVLASASPRRAELLARVGLSPQIRPADLDETAHDDEDPHELVLRLARAKAAAVAGDPAAHDRDVEVVLAADTVVVLDGQALGKPRDRDHAAAMLRALSARTHEVVTGLAVRRGRTAHDDLVITRVTFRELSEGEVAWYLDTGEPHDKAGAYGLQGAAAALVSRVEGSDTNVIGLPLAEAVALLRRVGLDPLKPSTQTPR